MDIIFQIEQPRAKNAESVLFPNLIHELKNDFITSTGITFLENYNPMKEFSMGFLPERIELKSKTEFNKSYMQTKSSEEFFMIKKESWVNKTFLINNFKDDNELKSLINQSLSTYKIDTFENQIAWITYFDSVKSISKNPKELIYQLGLDHYATDNAVTSKESENLIGLRFKFKKDTILFKPNIICNPSTKAYNSKNYNSKSVISKTMSLCECSPKHDEFIIPMSCFTEMNVELVDIFIYKQVPKPPLSSKDLINAIFQELKYDKTSTINYKDVK